ncbi:NAD+ synthase [Aliikangiella sp. G2MR2-5]|uniref:NAD+ synthase n=1 Tax=Aliikangiella sp. G2MR2-5 TaxID=2788943 RepID=UPI001AED8F22
MKITMAQLNFTVGDVDGNLEKIIDAYRLVENEDGLLVCSELALTGYYPQDLVYQQGIIEKQLEALAKLKTFTQGKAAGVVVGYIAKNHSDEGKPLFNALAVLSNGEQIFEYHKKLLPTYNVFDESRHFNTGEGTGIFEYKGKKIGFSICEDIWARTSFFNYSFDPVEALEKENIEVLISINASPSNLGKQQDRLCVIAATARRLHAPLVYVNQVGGNDELVFDGASLIVNEVGEVLTALPAFEEQLKTIDLNELKPTQFKPISDDEIRYRQTILGIRDYIQKCGFNKVVIGSSGGIDSAVTLAICAEALGSANVTAITMPSKFSSKGSVDDSIALCENLGVRLLTAPIGEEYELAVKQFEAMAGEHPSKLTKENIQARIRGRKLMEYSNQFGALVVSTGNKSEMSVGYATLYGDMNGGVNPLGDLYKMEVYALAKYFNQKAGKEVIPQAIIDKAPSAELSEEQLDSDFLPDYRLLDAVLKLYIEGRLLSESEVNECNLTIKEFGPSNEELNKIHQMVNRAEFKRKQAPPIIRIQKKSFGVGRRMPVAAKY